MEDRGGGAHEGGHGPGDGGGPSTGQLIVLLGAGFQVCANRVSTFDLLLCTSVFQEHDLHHHRSPKSVAKHDIHTVLGSQEALQ